MSEQLWGMLLQIVLLCGVCLYMMSVLPVSIYEAAAAAAADVPPESQRQLLLPKAIGILTG